MVRDLYFIPKIAVALKFPDPESALRTAFEEIMTLGRQVQYRQGFLQFLQFMTMVRENSEKRFQRPEEITFQLIRWLALRVGGDLLEENQDEIQAVVDLVGSEPRWQEEFEKICREVSKSKIPPRRPEVIIERNGERIDSATYERLPITKEIKKAKPGQYTVSMDTGRIIWQEELKEQELIWASAFPERALPLAADIGEIAAQTTKEITLLKGDLIIRVFPEIEGGRIELKIGGASHG
jgi:hypothetical protein